MATTELIPLEVLFGNPERSSPRLSPDGARLGYIAPVDGVLNVWVGAFGSDDFKPVTDDRDRGIRTFYWAHDNRHLLYLQDKGGDENWRLYDVDLDTGAIRDLTPFEGVQAQVIALDKLHPDHVLVGLNKDNEQLHDVYRLDLPTGSLEKVEENPGFVGWVADADLVVRCGVAPTPEGGMAVMVRETVDADWRPLLTFDFEDALTSGPVAFTLDGSGLYALSSAGVNAGQLVRLDVTTGAAEVLAGDDTYDVTGGFVDPDTRELQFVTYLRDRIDYQVLDPAVADDVTAIRALDPGDALLEGEATDNHRWVVAFTHDDGPVRFYVYDCDTDTGTYLFSARPELERYTCAAMEPFSFTARDGLEIHGYATFPAGVERTNLPTVLNVHGGPWARDTWGFNPEAQWLANRGYLCVQVNYRGSTGYGKDFVNAGNREWGGKMHDDLLDAIDHVVGQGLADRDRVAIYGGSYGGYAALVGATFTPDVFRCAVDIVGPSSIKTLIESVPPYWVPLVVQFHSRVGNPETEEDFLWSRSPLSKVDNITIPLLIAQGANDPRVKQAESEQIVAALRERNVPHEYMLFEDEGHGFAKPENKLKFYAAAERFLAQHLKG